MKEFWNERYASQDYFYGVRPNEFLATVTGMLHSQSEILCLAEGEGRNAVYLASLGHKVTAVDFSEEGRRKALALAAEKNVDINYILSPLENFEFDIKKWDAVVSIFCHLDRSLRPDIHRKVQSSLKENGLFILQSYTPKQLEYGTGGPKQLSMLYDEADLRSDFPGMKWIRLESTIADIREGSGHTGKSSVLNAIGIS